MYNWIVELGLLCAKHLEVGLFGSSYFAGFALSSLTLGRLGDLYVRAASALTFRAVNEL